VTAHAEIGRRSSKRFPGAYYAVTSLITHQRTKDEGVISKRLTTRIDHLHPSLKNFAVKVAHGFKLLSLQFMLALHLADHQP